MTPAARVSAAIGILDDILAGGPAEKVLTQWGRDNRYAGSGDRAAVRDHVFDALRRRRSYAALSGAETGRGIMVGALRTAGVDLSALFTGMGHAPAPLTPEEAAFTPVPELPGPVRCDVQDWLYLRFQESLGDSAEAAMRMLRDRAPVHLRVNLLKATREQAVKSLAGEGIGAILHPLVKTALQVVDNERKIKNSKAYADGLIELQDAASQAAMLRLPLRDGDRVVDYCAGGGGKALAMAALARIKLYAHDIDPRRMADLPARGLRAGVVVEPVATAALGGLAPVDLVLIDAPCSGSGTWRRAPDAKWRLTPDGLDHLCAVQAGILDDAARLVRPGGHLAYATCSILRDENQAQTIAFQVRHAGWELREQMQLLPSPLHDGFYLALLKRT